MASDIRLAYSSLTNQVRVSFPVEEVGHQSRPSRDLMRRAKSKLEDELSAGLIESYVLYEEALNKFWSHLQRAKLSGRVVNFLLAQGYRHVPELSLRQDIARNWTLTLPDAKTLADKFPWYKYLAWATEETGMEPFRNGPMRAALLEPHFRAMRGERIKDFKLRLPTIDSEATGVRVVQDKEHQRVLLYLYDGEGLATAESSQALLQKITDYLDRLLERNLQLKPLKKELTEFLRELRGGPESFGYGLPIIFPIAFRPAAAVATATVSSASVKQQPPLKQEVSRVGSRKLNSREKTPPRLITFEVSSDGLEACVSWADEERLSSGHYDRDRTWLDEELKQAGIVFGYEAYVEKILSLLTLGQALKGKIIARGIPPQPGEEVYWHPCYLDRTLADGAGHVGLLSAQNKLIVEVGDLICELRYRDGKLGTSVYGQSVGAAADPNLASLEVGPGVERRSDGKFYAVIRGIPYLEANQVSCLDAYVHRGDVNIQTGDIYFDGSVEVRGNIDNGARVYTKGDLIVKGSIGQARVRCDGDLNVSKGIITTQDGVIFVTGNAYAQFIENSRITIGRSLEVERSVINSDIRVGGDLVIRNTKQGLIGGGSITVQHSIRTVDLGFSDGEKTSLRIGSDWRIEYRVSLLKARLLRLKRYLQRKQTEWEEAKKRVADGRGATLESRIDRARKLIEKIEQKVEILRARIRWSDQAILIVKGAIDPNVDIMIAGRGVPIVKSMREIMVTGNRFRDQFVNPLGYLDQYWKQLHGKSS